MYVGNAKQSAHYYKTALGTSLCGLETDKDRPLMF
jgi:hypothetical protein